MLVDRGNELQCIKHFKVLLVLAAVHFGVCAYLEC